MPIKKVRKGASKKAKQAHAAKVISEFHHGTTYAATARKFGKARAEAQAKAVGMERARLSRKRTKSKKKG